jgi:hypothetical protein
MIAFEVISVSGGQARSWVAQRFSAAINALFSPTASAAEGAIENQGALRA